MKFKKKLSKNGGSQGGNSRWVIIYIFDSPSTTWCTLPPRSKWSVRRSPLQKKSQYFRSGLFFKHTFPKGYETIFLKKYARKARQLPEIHAKAGIARRSCIMLPFQNEPEAVHIQYRVGLSFSIQT